MCNLRRRRFRYDYIVAEKIRAPRKSSLQASSIHLAFPSTTPANAIWNGTVTVPLIHHGNLQTRIPFRFQILALTSCSVNGFSGFLLQSNLPYIAAYFLISSILLGSSSGINITFCDTKNIPSRDLNYIILYNFATSSCLT